MSDALLIVDVQNDFCPGGALAVAEGDAVVPVLNEYIARAQAAGMPIFASRDWHPPVTRHFALYGGPWPVHCVQGTPGAAFHPDLRLPPGTPIATTGDTAEDAGYSMFEGTLDDGRPLADALRERGITRVHVGGLATDYCVRATVLDALHQGFEARVLTDAARGVNVTPGDDQRALDEMAADGARLETLREFPS
ncbi:MAG TPA: bifunctional nicotinamidase/pyrazinamidase [Thermomicrobiales bacterium]|nr:bifunctional nicotinamidase/pyrazinamidase [Thermomicrobiales bacterium]